MWWWDGSHWPMMFWPFGFLIICFVVMALMMRHGDNSRRRDSDPLDILRRRFARGEIDQKEYEDRKQILSER